VFNAHDRAKFDYLSIYEIYIAPLQGNYLGALPAQARAKIKVLKIRENKYFEIMLSTINKFQA